MIGETFLVGGVGVLGRVGVLGLGFRRVVVCGSVIINTQIIEMKWNIIINYLTCKRRYRGLRESVPV